MIRKHAVLNRKQQPHILQHLQHARGSGLHFPVPAIIRDTTHTQPHACTHTHTHNTQTHIGRHTDGVLPHTSARCDILLFGRKKEAGVRILGRQAGGVRLLRSSVSRQIPCAISASSRAFSSNIIAFLCCPILLGPQKKGK